MNEVSGPLQFNMGLSDLPGEWLAGNKNAEKEVAAKLAGARLTFEDVTAKTVEIKLDFFERLDRMMASAEARRNNALREIERHREALGAAARKVVEEVVDAGFTDLETGVVHEATE